MPSGAGRRAPWRRGAAALLLWDLAQTRAARKLRGEAPTRKRGLEVAATADVLEQATMLLWLVLSGCG